MDIAGSVPVVLYHVANMNRNRRRKKLKLFNSGIVMDCLQLDTTDVLTRQGWVPLAELQEGQEILVNSQGTAFWEVPSEIIRQKNRQVYEIGAKNFSIITTVGHRHVHVTRDKWAIKTTGQVQARVGDIRIPHGSESYEGETIDPTLAYLIGFILGDGTRDHSNYKIVVSKETKIEKLSALSREYVSTSGEPTARGYIRFGIKNKWTPVIDSFFLGGKDINFESFLKLSSESMAEVLRGIKDSDGHVRSDRPHTCVTSVREDHIDLFQTLGAMCGVKVKRRKSVSNENSTFPSDRPLHSVSIHENKYSSVTYKGEVGITDVGCVVVSTGMFTVRHNGQVFVTGNCHIPFQHKGNYGLMLDVFEDAGVDEIVIIGDYGDFYFCNGHGKDPEIMEYWTPKREIAAVRRELEKLATRFPETRIIYIEGNHEYRLERYLKNKAPELFGLVEYQELLDPTGQNVDEWVPYGPEQIYQLAGGKSKLFARHEPLSGGQFPALNTVKRANTSLIFGHTHASQRAEVRLFDGSHHVGATFGFLGDRDHPAFSYVKTKPTWIDGFALCTTDLKTGEFFLEGVTIVNGRCKANGTIYG